MLINQQKLDLLKLQDSVYITYIYTFIMKINQDLL